jgi:hypothetical protein
VFDIAGLFVLLAFTVAITIGLTAVWPLLLSVDKGVTYLVDKEIEREERMGKNMGKAPLTQTSKCRYFKLTWLLMGGIVTSLLSGVAGHMICATFGLPTIAKRVQVGECLFLDTASLGSNNSPYAPVNYARRLRADANITNTTEIEFPEDAARAEVAVNSDGSVDFYTNCEGSLYQASTGAVWQIVPEYGVVCQPVLEAFHVIDVKPVTQKKCTLGSWSNDAHGPPDGFPFEQDMGQWGTGESCGFLGLGGITARAWATWNIEKQRNWEYCNIATQPTYLKRIDTNGQTQVIMFNAHLTVDPRITRQYGWHTSGDEEIISTAESDLGHGTNYVFDPIIVGDEGIRNYIIQQHFARGGTELIKYPIKGMKVRPSSFECRMMLRVPNGNDFTEFQPGCASVTANVAGDDETAGLKIMTASVQMCTVIVGFIGSNLSTTISVNKLTPVTLRGADKWRCQTMDNGGYNCDPNWPFEAIDPEVVESYRRAVVEYSDPDTGTAHSTGGIEVSWPFGDLFNLGGVIDVIVTIIIVIAVCAALGLIIWLVIKLVKTGVCKRKKIEIAIKQTTQQVPAQTAEVL